MKDKTLVASRLAEIGYDPVSEAVAIARDEETDPRILTIRAKIACDLLQYVQPKLKAIEITGKDGEPLQLELFDWQSLVKRSGE